MFTKEQFQKAIFSGLGSACDDAHFFTGTVNARIKPEYVVTVNIAKALFSSIKPQTGYGYGITISIEELTSTFATACVPIMKMDDMLNMYGLHEKHDVIRNKKPGKIDIAVYDESGKVPICPIEVKDFAPSDKEVKLDVRRIVDLLEIEDANTGPSVIEMGFLACLEEHRNCTRKEEMAGGLEKAKRKYENRIKSFGSFPNNIDVEVITETVAHNLLKSVEDLQGMDAMDQADRVSELYHFVGVVVVITKKKR